MAIEIKLPDLGDGIESGDILEVLVKEGDTVDKDQGLIEIETDKATVEVPSTHAGTVSKVHVAEGQSLAVGQTIVTLETSDATGAQPESQPETPAQAAAESKPPSAEPAPPREEGSASQEPELTPTPKAAPATAPPSPGPATGPPTPAAPTPDAPAPGDLAPAGPAVRRFAREVGVDLLAVTGTGPGGRITRDDVLAVVRKSHQPGRATPAPAEHATESDERVSEQVAERAESSRGIAEQAGDDGTTRADTETDAWGRIRVEKMSKIRKTIAAKMHASWSTVPRVTNFDDADVTELERIRQSSKADYAAVGIKLTSMPFLIKAVALSLRSHPVLNAAIDTENERIIYREYVNIGIAVDTDRGLIVPSLRSPDEMSISGIARSLATLSQSVHDNSFQIDDLRGSTFTISNLGAIGGSYSTPIINTPEVAILLVGRSRNVPVVLEDNEIAPRLMMPLSLSYDHRLVDGAAAARFLNDVIRYLQDPSRLLLAP
jgi:pyruvate dehydrogenase E2 component (dihydrolipoamide acetyltransferase)